MSKALNELKKATMASYLAKAGGRVRSGTTIAADFERDHYKAMATANKHHPNMVTPGFEKDPEKLKRAEAQMKVTGDLRDTFKRDAYNRIKGIARAGRLLAKEDALNEYKNTESHPSLWDTHELVHKSGKVLKKGDVVKGFRGHYKVHGFETPHHSGSTGRVYVHSVNSKGRKIPGSGYGMDGKDPQSLFPSVIDAKIVAKKGVKEEVVNELKKSTLWSVANKRYQQAQDALKAKNYDGYAKGMKKAHAAADASIPKTGWSPEDDPVRSKNEEVVVESPQEKYRKMKAAKVKGACKCMGEGSWDKEQAEKERQSKTKHKDEGDTGLFSGVLPTKNLSKAQQKAFDKVLPKRK